MCLSQLPKYTDLYGLSLWVVVFINKSSILPSRGTGKMIWLCTERTKEIIFNKITLNIIFLIYLYKRLLKAYFFD